MLLFRNRGIFVPSLFLGKYKHGIRVLKQFPCLSLSLSLSYRRDGIFNETRNKRVLYLLPSQIYLEPSNLLRVLELLK